MEYNLIVKDFGKIKEANIHVSPLTLFVGDNNSGKSYLLSLLWGLQSECANLLLSNVELLECKEYSELLKCLSLLFKNVRLDGEANVIIQTDTLIAITNELLEMNKDNFVKNIFNDIQVQIGKMEIQKKNENIAVHLVCDSNEIY